MGMKNPMYLPLAVLVFGLTFVFLPPLQAQEAEKAPVFSINVDPKVYDPSAFQSIQGAKVGALQEYKSEIPTREKRESVFAKVRGLDSHLDGWDELERDMLYMKASYKNITALRKDFPKIPQKQLSDLQLQIKKGAK